jgi:signal transduction histidine kinase
MTSNDLSSPILPAQPNAPFIMNWIQRFLEPHQSLTDDLSRRRSRLLGGMMLITLLVGVIGLTYTLINSPSSRDDLDTYLVVVGLVLVLVALLVNRTGRVYRASQIFIGVMLPVFTLAPFVPGGDLLLTFFVALPILLAGIFFSERVVALLAVGSTVLVAIQSFAGSKSMMPTFFLSMFAGVTFLFIKYLQFQEQVRTAKLQEINLLLRASEESLEHRVQERTRDLQVAADVSLQITTQLDATTLLENIVEQTASAFDLYHVSIFLHEPDTKTLRLMQGVGQVGDDMVAQGKRFRLADDGLVPTAGRGMQPALAADVTQNSNHVVNPLLPDTQSELAIPMIYQGQLIGVLDLQSDQVNRFRPEDIRILRTLADQIAVSVRNSQLFEETVVARREAEQANTVKSAFLASMSHELRTPLNAIINFSKFLRKGIPGPVNEEQEKLAGHISDSGQHLLNLINDVLDMSKIEAGSLKLYLEQDVDVRKIVETAIKYTEPLLAEKSVELILDLPETLPTITGDRKRLLQIFLNVFSNACKFTEEGSVKVGVQRDSKRILVTATDSGLGIAQEDAEFVFTAFKQSESGLRQGGNGTGLGMPISLKLVEAHEGRIWFESVVNEGTTFFIELPLQTSLMAQGS